MRRNQHKRPGKNVHMESRKVTKPGSFNRRIIASGKADGREYHFHATKGWRSFRA